LKARLFGDAQDWQCEQQGQIFFEIKFLIKQDQAEVLWSHTVDAFDP